MKFLKNLLICSLALCLLLAGCSQTAAPGETTSTVPAPTQPVESVPAQTPDLSAPLEYDGQLDPAAVALVGNGDTVTAVSSAEEMAAAICAEGTTRIRLLQDIRRDKALSLPYSCYLDLDGHTIATNPEKGTGIMVVEAGSVNPVTTIKNGTFLSNGISLWVNGGGIVVDNMQIQSTDNICLGLFDPDPAYKDFNLVTDSTLVSGGNGCISFHKPNTDFSGTGITVQTSQLINSNPEGGHLFIKSTTECTAGVYHLGENVTLCTYASTAIPDNYLYFTGAMAHKTQQQDLQVMDITCPQIQHWSTESDLAFENLLFIGNSFCYYFVQELQGMTAAVGRNVNIVNLYEAGCRIDEHWDWLNNPESVTDPYELWITNDMGRFMHGDIRTLGEALELLDWDIITLQQHFTPGKAKTYEVAMESCTPYAKNMFDYLKSNHPDAELFWHEHWAFQVGHKTVPDLQTQTNQYENLRAASITISQENGVTMIPGGDAWQLARADAQIGDTLCKTDMLHDGETQGGQYLNACVWFETLFKTSCLGNTWKPEYQMSEQLQQSLQTYAHQAVSAFHGADYAK